MLHQQLPSDAEEEIVTFADELRAEGREEGREEGRQEAIRAIMESLMEEGASSVLIERISALAKEIQKETETA